MFLPFLRCLADGQAKHTSVLQAAIEESLNISEEDRQEMIPSGQSSKVANRVGWTRTHLNKAGLVEQVTRGHYRITPEGMALLGSPLAQAFGSSATACGPGCDFDLRFLRKYKYPPEGCEQAIALVLKQAEALADDWSAGE